MNNKENESINPRDLLFIGLNFELLDKKLEENKDSQILPNKVKRTKCLIDAGVEYSPSNKDKLEVGDGYNKLILKENYGNKIDFLGIYYKDLNLYEFKYKGDIYQLGYMSLTKMFTEIYSIRKNLKFGKPQYTLKYLEESYFDYSIKNETFIRMSNQNIKLTSKLENIYADLLTNTSKNYFPSPLIEVLPVKQIVQPIQIINELDIVDENYQIEVFKNWIDSIKKQNIHF